MANAAMLVVGGGSYATYGALACRGSVRMPRCVLKFSEQQDCAPPGARLAVRLHAYDRPSVHVPRFGERELRRPRTRECDERNLDRATVAAAHLPSPNRAMEATDGLQDPKRPNDSGDAAAGARRERAPACAAAFGGRLQPRRAPLERATKHDRSAVLVTSFNAAYLDLYLNWACHTCSHGLRHLVWLQDRATACGSRSLRHDRRSSLSADPELEASASDRMRILPPAPSSVERPHATLFYSEHLTRTVGVAPWSASFRTRAFNRLSMFKLLIIRHVLVGGRDAWFCGVDVVFVRNPWPLFLRAARPD